MKRLLLLSVISLSVIVTVHSVHGAQYWAKTWGGDSDEHGYSIGHTVDGGNIVVGSTYSFGAGSSDLWVLKFDSNGDVSWQKTCGGEDFDCAWSVQQTADEGYIVAGGTYSFGAGDLDSWVIKLNGNGDITWQKIYGGSGPDYAWCIRQTVDEGYIMAGYTGSYGAGGLDFWVIKLENNGNIVWKKTYGGIYNDRAYSIQQTIDGGYLVAGESKSYGAGDYDILLIKLESDGDVSWQQTYGGSGDEYAYSIQQTVDGGYIVAGSFEAGNDDFWVLRLKNSGDILWQKTYGGSGDDYAWSIQQTMDGGYIVAGTTDSFGAGSGDIWLLKLESDGGVSWQKTYGGSEMDDVRSIKQTIGGGFIMVGTTDSFGAGSGDLWMLKLDCFGDITECSMIDNSSAIITIPSVSGSVVSTTVYSPTIDSAPTTITPGSSSGSMTEVCESIQPDSDTDGIIDICDNCPVAANGPYSGICTGSAAGEPCLMNGDCLPDGFCSMNQEDSDLDSAGDVCDPDDDNDSILDVGDNCPYYENPGQEDFEGDGRGDSCDNCLKEPNGPFLGTCATSHGTIIKGTGVECTSEGDCGSGEICQMNQEDCNSNSIGDACECYADIDGDGTVYPSDLSVFLVEYGRTDCITNPLCEADVDGDGNVYPADLSLFIDEYGKEDCPLPMP